MMGGRRRVRTAFQATPSSPRQRSVYTLTPTLVIMTNQSSKTVNRCQTSLVRRGQQDYDSILNSNYGLSTHEAAQTRIPPVASSTTKRYRGRANSSTQAAACCQTFAVTRRKEHCRSPTASDQLSKYIYMTI